MEYERKTPKTAELKDSVAEKRNYHILNVEDARNVANTWLDNLDLAEAVSFGLPEIDDRYHFWRVPLKGRDSQERVGEVVIDAYTSLLLQDKSTSPDVLEARLLHRKRVNKKPSLKRKTYKPSNLRNTLALGNAEKILRDFPEESIDLIFTSPPYFNARPEYEDYVTYEEYLLKIQKVIKACHRVLNEGRFFVMNVSPILIRRASRSESSKRIAVPFDMHRLFVEEGFDFVDDIIWVKPEGAGWATGRGRRFSADRNPLQYKSVPVSEYVLVYRKQTKRLIDWNIRTHPNQEKVKASRITDDYERTNIWKMKPAHDKNHPAVFPEELAAKVIAYYSFIDDVVLDPFAGSGTVGLAAVKSSRRFVLIDKTPKYVNLMRERAKKWLGKEAADVLCLNCPPISVDNLLM
ncbi:MAG: site-specific DNA-methyltransferase [Anaerolineaceae bacterium 4572_5.1]|nr:MAG: site-specific DNA-methyltransferase [Anaerolineaceae bacterium 4572_5.1]